MAGKVWKISICMMLTVLLCACTGNDMMEKKVRDLDFTVVSAEDISEELKSHIDERKEETFTLIYRDGENMYLIVGYGSQEGGGYSIRVNDLYLGVHGRLHLLYRVINDRIKANVDTLLFGHFASRSRRTHLETDDNGL